jgi:hypothetical protein
VKNSIKWARFTGATKVEPIVELTRHGRNFMPSKKKTTSDKRRPRKAAAKRQALDWTLGLPNERGGSNGTREYQRIRNPQTAEEREKWLEKRDKLTLQAFEMAYENHHQRKAS